MLIKDIINESAASDLAKRLPSLAKYDDNILDRIVKKIADKHKLSRKAVHALFLRQYNHTPKGWVMNKLDEEGNETEISIPDEAQKFAEWIARRIHLQSTFKIELSYDTQDAQDNHHTGRHIEGDDTIWVYAKNRNLVDILRTIAHELTHVRQGELDMIKPGDSYPGSPIEMLADMVAGKWIKVYGEQNHYIFQ